jgi:5-carboxymethyl-2-hydroxymuconate isomerase
MPHIIVEYSANLPNEHWDIDQLLNALVDAAVATTLFPASGMRARAIRCDHYLVGDGNPNNGFLNVTMRVGAGRDPGARQKAGEHIFATLRDELSQLTEARPVALSFEMTELNSVKFNYKTT